LETLTMTAPTRATTRALLEQVRADLSTLIATQSEAALEALRVTDVWDGVDMLRHISVWNELTTRCLADWLGPRDWVLDFASDQNFNVEMVAARRHLGLAQVLEQIEGFHAGYAAALAQASDEELAQRAGAPWGEELERVEMIAGILSHDAMHLRSIYEALRAAT
jgi:hypothetical protein